MNKSTAQAPSNIAFIKYWGKADETLRLPLNSSFSMNLSNAFTTTTVEFSDKLSQDDISIIGEDFSEKEIARISSYLDLIRKKFAVLQKAKVVTKNSFPKGTGVAASASGFAALILAAVSALEQNLSEKELTVLARCGSGSACRSIPDGFVIWKKGETSEESYAHSVFPSSHWDLCDAILIVDSKMKKVSTSSGMQDIFTSPFAMPRISHIEKKIEQMQTAFSNKNFTAVGELIEEDCLNMHAVMMTQRPALLYWNDKTLQIINYIYSMRAQGIPVFFTIDAGPNVHVIFEAKNKSFVMNELNKIDGVEKIIENTVTSGTKVIEDHLF